MFGIVLRVQQILHFFPASFTNLFVFVAIPEICDKKFNATLSAIKIFLAFPSIVAIREPFLIFDPSFFILNLILLSTKLKACFANNKPPTIAFSFERSLTLMFLLFLTKLEVISPDG